MPVILLVAILAVGWTLTGVLSVIRTKGLREANDFLHEAQSDAMDRAITAEREAATAQTELTFTRQSFMLSLQQPRYVALTEENVQQLGALITSLVKQPNQMN
jgi:hypothetical protein